MYDNLASIKMRSQSIYYHIDELLNENDILINISDLRWNYDEVLQDLQKLNSYTLRTTGNYNVNLKNYSSLSVPMLYLRLRINSKLNIRRNKYSN